MTLLRLRGQACALVVLTAPLVLAAPAHATTKKPKTLPKLAAPAAVLPADSAVTDSAPAFSWKPVKGAAKYQFELSADSGFNSIVNGQGHGSFTTGNTFGATDKTMPNGTYFWHVRAVDAQNNAGVWSKTRVLRKSWTTAPVPQAPIDGVQVSYPSTPLVLSWSTVPRAANYLVYISSDPALGSLAVSDNGKPIETAGTVYAVETQLAAGHYYWAVVPEDAEGNKGVRSQVRSFDWSWPTTTTVHASSTPTIFDPQFSWDAVPGAAKYQVEVNYSPDFATGSKVCCDGFVYGTTYSPVKIFPNSKVYHWRVRAVDAVGNSGVWNVDPATFEEHFDAVTPSIPNLHMRDNLGNTPTDLYPGGDGILDTASPVVTWDPVPGASSYDVKVAPWDGSACNWGDVSAEAWQSSKTAVTAWTPLAPSWSGSKPNNGAVYPHAANDQGHYLVDGDAYCVQVAARADRDGAGGEVEGPPTQVNGLDHPAFRYRDVHNETLTPVEHAALASTYVYPDTGTTQSRTPFFTWRPLKGAAAYYVVVAADQYFTNVVDFAITLQPSYAPRTLSSTTTYPDADGTYYWSVIPCQDAICSVFTAQPQNGFKSQFRKQSTPPVLTGVSLGATNQPTFSWYTSAGLDMPGVRSYRVQVAQDPSFGTPIDDVVTDSTTFTPTKTYPADTNLWWRVRVDDENMTGLNWSQTSSFSLTHGVPVPLASNPTAGEAIPVLSWTPVAGAVSYDMHVDQADGTTKDFSDLHATSFTPTLWTGIGVWHWQVRAVFPKGASTTPGPYSGPQAFTRSIGEPTGATQTASPGRVLFSWNPSLQIPQYKVQVSTTNSFAKLVDDETIDNTVFAPDLSKPLYMDGGVFFWRVAAVDEDHNVGGWTTHTFKLPARMVGRVAGFLRVGKAGKVTLTVKDSRTPALKGVKVKPTGIGVSSVAKLTTKRGTVTFVLTPKRAGTVTFTLTKKGYQKATITLNVR